MPIVRTVSGKSKWDEGGESAQLITDAVNIALSDFIKQFAYDFSSAGFVTQTTGNGRWARISLGTNTGLRFHSKVEFLKSLTGNVAELPEVAAATADGASAEQITAALKAVELTAPFRPLPADFKGQNIDIQFTFDYRVFGGTRY